VQLEVERAARPRLVRQRRWIRWQGQVRDIRIAGTRGAGVEEGRWLVVPSVVRPNIIRVCANLFLNAERLLITSGISLGLGYTSTRRYKQKAANDRYKGDDGGYDARP